MRRMPGQRLLALARHVLPSAELDCVIEPAIADLQHEWRLSTHLPFSHQMFVRARAYLGALRVLFPRMIGAGLRVGVEPPSRALIVRFFLLAVVFTGVVAGARSFVDQQRGTAAGYQWLFYLPDHLAVLLPVIPALWASWFERGPLGGPAITPRARDVATLTLVVLTVYVVWSGWTAPLLRQQYLVAHNLSDFATASVHQWTTTQLLEGLRNPMPGASASRIASELHMRLIEASLAILWALAGWLHVRGSRIWNRAAGFGVSFAVFTVAVLTFWITDAATPPRTTERFVAEWLCLVALIALGLAAIRVLARVERRRRTVLEARVVVLLQAIADVKHACARDPRGHA